MLLHNLYYVVYHSVTERLYYNDNLMQLRYFLHKVPDDDSEFDFRESSSSSDEACETMPDFNTNRDNNQTAESEDEFEIQVRNLD